MAQDVFDITIIGGGPTGLYGAFYAGLRGMRTKLIDALPELGGQLAALYPEKDVYDVAGFRQVQARQLVREMVEQGLSFDPAVCLEERVLDLLVPANLGGDTPLLLRSDRAEHLTRAVLIAAGVGAFAPRRLDAPGVAEFEGRGVHYFVRHLDRFAGRRVLVVGGGDSAVDWALALSRRAASVTLIHRRDSFRAHEDSLRQLHDSPAVVRTCWEIAEVRGDDWVTGAVLTSNRGGETEAMPVDEIILSLGFKADLGPIGGWGLDLERGGIKVDAYMRTNLPRVYAAGDIAAHPAKLKLIATGFAEAATAVNFAKAELDPAAKAFPGHSSELSR